MVDKKVAVVIAGYAVSSSTLLIINKLAIVVFPYPAVLTALQYLVSTLAAFVFLAKEPAATRDRLEWEKVKAFLPVAVVFYMAIFSNTRVLQHSNVETVIVFRATVPVLVSVTDHVFRHTPLPSLKTLVALLAILVSAMGYMYCDSSFSMTAYQWAIVYLLTLTFDTVYVKYIIHSLSLSMWGMVLYNNILSLSLLPVALVFTGEHNQLTSDMAMDLKIFAPVFMSCVAGVAISFYGFSCRQVTSATTFTVVGVINKLFTVIINVVIWDKHATPLGLFFICCCIASGVFYQQTLSGGNKKPPVKVHDDEVGKEDGKQTTPKAAGRAGQ
mmetsp:Transcript_236/g.497  ORF Transcript_236/g.497 Transcript_236/m.497 type:complete len:328 (+) Transcript_236:198-1181(+)